MRALVVCLVVALAFVLVVPTVGHYVAVQQTTAQLRDQIAQSQARADQLQAELDRWQDPAYVAAQARERLSFVFPGETPYRVVDQAGAADDPAGTGSAATPEQDQPWYTTMWDSVGIAGSSATGHENE